MKINALKTLLSYTRRARQSKIEEAPERARLLELFFESDKMKVALWTFLAVVMTIMVTPRLIVPGANYRLDDIAVHTVNAPQDFSVEDKKATEIRREDRLRCLPGRARWRPGS